MTKKKGIFTLAGMILALIAGGYVAVFGLDAGKTGSAEK